MLLLLTFGSLGFALGAWAIFFLTWRRRKAATPALIALIITTLNAAFAAGLSVHFHLHPTSPRLPPWRDPEILDFGLFFFLAPIGMTVAGVAGFRGASKWLVSVLELALLPLLLLGIAAGMAV